MRVVRGFLLGLARLGLGVLGELVGGYLLQLACLYLGFHVVSLFYQLTSRTHKAGTCSLAGTGSTHLFRHNQQE